MTDNELPTPSDYPVIEKLADLSMTTVQYDSHELVEEAIRCWRDLTRQTDENERLRELNKKIGDDRTRQTERVAANARDAARYRWLVSMAWGKPLNDSGTLHDLQFRSFVIYGEWKSAKSVADAAIDAASAGGGVSETLTKPVIVDEHGACSLCGGTHYGTGIYRCPFACKKCPGGFNTEPCERADCGRKP